MKNIWYYQTLYSESTIHKTGRFSSECIDSGKLVVSLYGNRVLRSEGKEYLPISKNYALKCEPTYINHSCFPNLALEDSNKFKSIRDIMPGDEFTLDYSLLIEKDVVIIKNCQCKTILCRNLIVGKRERFEC